LDKILIHVAQTIQISWFILLIDEKDCEYLEELSLGWGSEGRKISWVSWGKICESQDGAWSSKY